MKILKFKAENFQKLKVVEITPDGNIVTIAGKCEQGKTTILDAIHVALGGGKMPIEPIRQGEKKANIEIDLGDMVVTRSFTPSGSTLKIVNKDGFKATKPQDLLDRLVGKLAFDPLEFARADSKKQVEMLLGVIDLKVDADKLKNIAGVEVKEHDNPLDTLNETYKEVAEERKLTNRQLNSAKKVLESLPEVEKVEKVSLAELVEEQDKLKKINKDNQIKRDEVVDKEQHIARLQDQKNAIQLELNRLKKELLEKEQELNNKNISIVQEKELLGVLREAVNSLQDEDLTDITNRIKNADSTNRQADMYAQRQLKQSEVNKYQAESGNYTNRLKKIIDYKNELVKNTKFPVDGLDFVNGGINYNSIPFGQASTAQKLKVSTAIGMAINPELKIMTIDGSESLDSTQLKIITDMANDKDYQLWMTRVSEDEQVGIYIEDGEVKK